MYNTAIIQNFFAEIRYLCKYVTRRVFLTSELQDNAHFPPILYNALFDLNVSWTVVELNPYPLLLKHYLTFWVSAKLSQLCFVNAEDVTAHLLKINSAAIYIQLHNNISKTLLMFKSDFE